MLSNTLRLNFYHLKIIHILHPRYHPKIIAHFLKNEQKSKYVCLHEIIRLIIMKMKRQMKNRTHRYDINRPRPKHGHKYGKYKKCVTMMMLICIKQHPSNIWSSIHEKVKQHWCWVEKKTLLIKKACSYETGLIHFGSILPLRWDLFNCNLWENWTIKIEIIVQFTIVVPIIHWH